jgi:hypothetical protein
MKLSGVTQEENGESQKSDCACHGRLLPRTCPSSDGTFRQSTAIIFCENLHGFHIDTNGIIAEQVQGATRRAQFGQTLSVSRAIGKFTLCGEIWHFSQPFQHGNAVGNLWVVSRTLRKNLVVDAGFNHGLTDTFTRCGSLLLDLHTSCRIDCGRKNKIAINSVYVIGNCSGSNPHSHTL